MGIQERYRACPSGDKFVRFVGGAGARRRRERIRDHSVEEVAFDVVHEG